LTIQILFALVVAATALVELLAGRRGVTDHSVYV
jgi:hypothetical protein